MVSREETTYKTLSVFAVQSMPNISIRKKKHWGFYGYSTIKHDYKLKTIRGDKVVVDKATGLMWHQSGTDDSMRQYKVKERVEMLNSEGYAGYHDWRLPTVEEAASLLEPSKKNGRYIDPVFSKKQKYIWTGNICGSRAGPGIATWHVSFLSGSVDWGHSHISIHHRYVRPVRSME